MAVGGLYVHGGAAVQGRAADHGDQVKPDGQVQQYDAGDPYGSPHMRTSFPGNVKVMGRGTGLFLLHASLER